MLSSGMDAVEERGVFAPPVSGRSHGVALPASITGLEENLNFCCLKYFPLGMLIVKHCYAPSRYMLSNCVWCATVRRS